MLHNSYEAFGVRLLECAREGKKLQNDRDAVELIGDALSTGAQVVIVPVERLEDSFFRLRTGVAGGIVQKFVQYRQRLAIVGDISSYTAGSSAFAAFVQEADRGKDIWFVPDLAELERRARAACNIAPGWRLWLWRAVSNAAGNTRQCLGMALRRAPRIRGATPFTPLREKFVRKRPARSTADASRCPPKR